jgi:hypothetical protein
LRRRFSSPRAALGSLIISLLLPLGVRAGPSDLGAFHEHLTEDRTDLLANGPQGVLVRHRWADGGPFEPATEMLAVPPTGSLTADTVAVRLTAVEVASAEPAVRVYTAGEGSPEPVRTARIADVEAVGFIRFTRLARLRLRPVQLTIDGQRWQVTGLDVTVRFAETEPFDPAPEDPLARPLIESVVVNPEGVARWATADPPPPPDLDLAPWRPEPVPGRWVRMMVDTPGPVRVDLADLTAAGVTREAIDLSRIEVFHHGQRTPLWIDPAGDGVIFVAPEQVEPYSAQTAFWLDLAGSGSPARMEAVRAAPPSPEEAADDPWEETVLTGRDASLEIPIEPEPTSTQGLGVDDRRAVWPWCELNLDEPVPIALPRLRGTPGARTEQGEVELHLVMNGGGQRRVEEIEVSPASGESVRAPVPRQLEFRPQARLPFPAAALGEEGLTLTPRSNLTEAQREAQSAGQVRHVYLASIAVRRPVAALEVSAEAAPVTLMPPRGDEERAATIRIPEPLVAFEVASSEPTALTPASQDRVVTLHGSAWRVMAAAPRAFPRPVSITPWRPTDLAAPSHRADMVIITHPSLREAAERLAAHHRAGGLAVEIVPVDAIYDDFGGGVQSPVAVRTFLATVLRRWSPPAPAYVVLLGDCSRDYHGDWHGPAVNFVPSFSDPNPSAREVFWEAADLRHVLVAGDDALADFFLGRLSTEDADSARALVDKVTAYETDAPLGPWRVRAGFIADNDRVSSQTFDEMCEEVRTDSMSPATLADTVYLRRLPWVDNFYLPKEFIDPTKNKVSTAATTGILDLFDRGDLLVTYYGHGGPNIWADERIWFGCDSPRSDNLRLTQTRRLPLLINMTCSSGAIDYPGPFYNICISEDFLRVPGGAVACFVPTGEGVPQQHQRLTHLLMGAIYHDGRRRIGEITTLAGWRFVLDGHGSDLVEHFVLLGDPALALAFPAVITPRPAERPALIAGEQHRLVCDVTPTSLSSAEAEVWLIDPSGHAAETRTLRRHADEEIPRQEFTLPADAARGRWTAAALWSDAASRRDELVHTDWVLDRPRLTLTQWSQVGGARPVAAGEPAEFTAALRCDSALPAGPLSLRLVDLARGDSTAPLATAEVSLRPGQTSQALLRWAAATPGLHLLAVRAPEGEDLWSDESETALRAPIPLPVVTRGVSAELTTLPELVTPQPDPSDPSRLKSLRVTVGNVGDSTAGPSRVTLMDARGLGALSVAAEAHALAAGALADVTVDLTGMAPVPSSAEGRVRIDWSEGAREEIRRNASIPVALARPLPDLAVVAGSVSAEPHSPSEGNTIFVNCEVVNRGSADASPVTMRLEGAGGQVLPDRADSPPIVIGRLRPGERRRVALRWDPSENAGDQTIRAVVDPDHAIVESDEANNEQSVVVHVRTGEDVRFTRAVGWRNPQSNPPAITLTTQIANFGETDGRDYVVTWYRDQAKTRPIGESPIDLIRAKETRDVTFQWVFGPEDIERQRRGERLAPTCTVGIRWSMRRATPPEEGEEAAVGDAAPPH